MQGSLHAPGDEIGGNAKDTSVLGQDERMGGLRGRQLLVLLSLAPWNCSVQRCNGPNGRYQERPSAKAGGEGMNQEGGRRQLEEFWG